MRRLISSTSSQKGFAHIGIILTIVGVLGIGGFVVWRYMDTKNASSDASLSSELAQKLASAKCEYDDKDLCKFFVSWKEHTQYKMTTTTMQKSNDAKSTSTIEVDGDNTHMTTTGEFASETISVGDRTTYIKATNGTWWKQTIPESQNAADATEAPSVDFDEPTSDGGETKSTVSYKALGKEACGSLNCFKYQVIDSQAPDVTEYLWFDDKAYQIHRTTTEDPESLTDTTFAYGNVSVKAPAAFKELGPNQYLIPGQSEPTTIPEGGDYLLE